MTMVHVHGPAVCLLRRLTPWRSRPLAVASAGGALRPAVHQTLHLRPLASRHQPAASASDEDLAVARKWLQKLDSETIPKNICDVSFSRSSGPGGQNVNKYRRLGFCFSYLGNC